MNKIKLLVIGVLVLFCTSFIQLEKGDIYTTWWTPNKDAKVRIFLATNGKVYGKITWLKEPNDANGNPKKDVNNKRDELKTREVMNLQILSGFSYDASYKWTGGKVYDAENGDSYDCVLTLKDKNTLNVRGYIQSPIFGKTVVFKRVE